MKISQNNLWPSHLPKPLLAQERNERRDASEHRRQILEVAQRLFAEHGVDAVSMHQIAKAAEVGQGTLYRRYANKGELCMDLLREQHERLIEEIAAQLTAKTNEPPLERLSTLLTQVVTFIEEQGTLLVPTVFAEIQAMHCEAAHHAQEFPPKHEVWYNWLHDLFASLYVEAIERKELPPLDVSYTTDALLASIHPMIYHVQRFERGFSSERILQGIRRIYIDGIKHQPE